MRLVAAFVACAGCGRIAFDPSPDAPDAYVTCQPLAPALTAPANVLVQEVAIPPDGLRLFAHQSNASAIHEATRTAPSTTFSAFSPTTSFRPFVGDITFIDIGGAITAFGHAPGTTRYLVYCPDPFTSMTCSPITMTDTATGMPITADHDGPSVAIRDGALVMVFNQDSALYGAQPTSADLLAWSATKIELPDADLTTGDPALTADGYVVVVPRIDEPGTFALRWDARESRYTDPQLILEGTTTPPDAPAIGVQDTTSFELLIGANTRGGYEPHHTTCTRR